MSLPSTSIRGILLTTVLIAVASVNLDANAQSSTKRGKGGSEVQGNNTGGTKNIEHCDQPMGTLAVVEPQDFSARAIYNLGLPSPTGLIRLIVQ